MKTVVVLGAGLAGAPFIHHFMKNVVLKRNDLKVVVVNPSDYFLWTIAMPRAVVPGQLANDKVLHQLAPSFKQYPSDKFEFVIGTASSTDAASNTVTISLASGGSQRVLSYDALVIATGSSAKEDMPWKMLDSSQHTIDSLQRVRDSIKKAKTIVVAGGGLTGVETAGELGFEYSKSGAKEVYFIYNDELPLSPAVMESVRKQSKTELQKLKVKLVSNTSVVGTSTTADGSTVLELRAKDGTTSKMTAQAYIPTIGMTPNTAFLPSRMLDVNGYVKQNSHLQAESHDNIFAIGDAGNLDDSRAMVADRQAAYLIKTLPALLDGKTAAEYVKDPKFMVGLTIGRSRGTGQMGNFKLFSLMIWWFKGRFLGTDYAHLIASGKKAMMAKID